MSSGGIRRSKAGKIMSLLAESGVIYCLVWVRQYTAITSQDPRVDRLSCSQIALIFTSYINLPNDGGLAGNLFLPLSVQITVCANDPSPPKPLFARAWTGTDRWGQGIYPTIIIVLVSLEKTILGAPSLTTMGFGSRTTRLQFTSGPVPELLPRHQGSHGGDRDEAPKSEGV